MKKTPKTISDSANQADDTSMKWIVGGVWAFVFFVAALLCIVLRLSLSHGGGIEAEVRGHGVARQVQCSRDFLALWTSWTCSAGEISWESPRELPKRVVPQKAPYTVLATSDWSGREFPVTSHLPMDWRTAGGLHESPPREILLAPEHPAGSDGWGAALAFIGLLIVIAFTALVAVILQRWRRWQR